MASAFPDFAARAVPFGTDWLGRQMALDVSRRNGLEPLVLLLEPGTGEALEIPVSFARFHERELVEHHDAALASSFFAEWMSANPDAIPLDHEHCVGYRVPLFLGGQDAVENLEVIDIEVYWSLCGQLRHGTRRLRPGTAIGSLALDD